jgi:hypothetical protein
MRRPTRWTVLTVALALTAGAVAATAAEGVAWRHVAALPTASQAVEAVHAGLPSATVAQIAWHDSAHDVMTLGADPDLGARPGDRNVTLRDGSADAAAARSRLTRAGWHVTGDRYGFTAERDGLIASWEFTPAQAADGAFAGSAAGVEVSVWRYAPAPVGVATRGGGLRGALGGRWLARRLRRLPPGPGRVRLAAGAIAVVALLALPTVVVAAGTVTGVLRAWSWNDPLWIPYAMLLWPFGVNLIG